MAAARMARKTPIVTPTSSGTPASPPAELAPSRRQAARRRQTSRRDGGVRKRDTASSNAITIRFGLKATSSPRSTPARMGGHHSIARSEEHTSELQSPYV